MDNLQTAIHDLAGVEAVVVTAIAELVDNETMIQRLSELTQAQVGVMKAFAIRTQNANPGMLTEVTADGYIPSDLTVDWIRDLVSKGTI